LNLEKRLFEEIKDPFFRKVADLFAQLGQAHKILLAETVFEFAFQNEVSSERIVQLIKFLINQSSESGARQKILRDAWITSLRPEAVSGNNSILLITQLVLE
jgi:hypothetical protein